MPLINRLQIVFDVTARQRRAAENDRHLDATLVHQLEVVFHDQRRLHEQAAHADRVGLVFLLRLQNVVDRLLDAEIDDLVAVVRQNDVDEILADVVHVAFDGRQHHRAFGGRAALLLHERFEKTHRRFHRFGRLQHERQLHLAAAEEIADDFHAVEQDVVDDVERGICFEGRSQLVFQPDLFAVDDVVLESLFDGRALRCLLRGFRFDVFEQRRELQSADRKCKRRRQTRAGRRSNRARLSVPVRRFDSAARSCWR